MLAVGLLLLVHLAHAQDPSGWTVARSGPGVWPEVRAVATPGEPPFQAWPSLVDTPQLTIACDEGKLRVYLATLVRPEVYGNAYDRWLTIVTLRFDDGHPRNQGLRKDVADDQLHFKRPKKWVRELSAHHVLHLQIVPFASNPTTTTFQLDGLQDAISVVSERCPL